MTNVLLFRSPDAGGGRDRYEVVLEERGYVPLTVPVLETALVHTDELRDKIARGPGAEGFSGVIMTSKRAVEAWCAATAYAEGSVEADWRTVPFYVVGAATACAASRIRDAFPEKACLAPAEGQVRGGAEAGTGERLAAFVLAEDGPSEGRRMLYLTGDRNRETLAETLVRAGIVLDTLDVYRTTLSSTFRADLDAALAKTATAGKCGMPSSSWGWVVHFAPSAAEMAAPVLSEVFDDRGVVVKVAAIGATTGAFLRDVLGVRVDAVAARPTPDGLVEQF